LSFIYSIIDFHAAKIQQKCEIANKTAIKVSGDESNVVVLLRHLVTVKI